MDELKDYRIQDAKVPHYRRGCLDILGLYYRKGKSVLQSDRAFYKNLKLKYPELAKYRDQEILTYIEGCNKFIVKTAIEHRDGVMLPANMGFMMICTMGKRTKAIDHALSAKLGKEVTFRNTHSEGYGAGVYYSTNQKKENQARSVKMWENCEYWSLRPNITFSRAIETAYKDNWKKYHIIPKSRRLTDMDDSYQKQLKTRKIIKQIKDTYDEFDFGTKSKDE